MSPEILALSMCRGYPGNPGILTCSNEGLPFVMGVPGDVPGIVVYFCS